jgi:spore coat protein U-like protein
LLAALLALAASFPDLARAGASCSFSPRPITLSFGRLGVSNLQGATTTGRFSESCLPGLQTAQIGVCARFGKSAAGGDEFNRAMNDGAGNSIAYGLYHDPQMTVPWLGESETVFLSTPYDTNSGASVQGTVYAKILSATAGLPAGTYTDDISGAAIVADSGYDGVSNACLSGLRSSDAPLLTVAVTLQASCTISASSMVFASAASPAASAQATSRLAVVCTKDTPYEVGLSAGMGAGATATARKMTGPEGRTIGYNLYRDPAHALPWGDAAGFKLSGVGAGGAQTLTVYGLAPAQAMGAPGLYTDTIIVTLTY